MLEELRATAVDDLEALLDVLERDAEQRREWLGISCDTRMERPEFMHKYTARTRTLFLERDKKVEAKIDNAEDDAELTTEAKEEIKSLREQMQAAIRSQTAAVIAEFEKQFQVNPMFQGFTSEDRALVCEANKKDCAGVERRIRAEYTVEIDKVRCSLTSRTRSSYYEKSAWNRLRRERRDREEIASCIALLAKERKLTADFEAGMKQRWKNDEEMTEAKESDARAVHLAELEKRRRDHKIEYAACRERKDRMGNARYIRARYPECEETDEHHALIRVYRLAMEKAYVTDRSTMEWERAVQEIDCAFIIACANGEWKAFIENVVVYWSCLAMPQRRRKWNRIITRYALLFLDYNLRSMRVVDVSHNTKMRELRDRRDDLLECILNMDQDIKIRIGRARREKIKIEKPMRALPVEVMVDYTIKAPEPEVKMASASDRADMMGLIGTNVDANSGGETSSKPNVKSLESVVGAGCDNPVADAGAANIRPATTVKFTRKNRELI